ncbi:MAG: hypothetical protein JXR25_01635 [Pontiellaceae bacterium]|nr:hypothetical protein [Pontiellaceae bacterium]MBN2783501.1 hypothetical protein [Pontiellaceae bacterium]
MKPEQKTLMLMLLSGAVAGFCSGVMSPSDLGLRGAAFGMSLAATVCIVRRKGWNLPAFLPGIILGGALQLMPLKPFIEGTNAPALRFDPFILLNAILIIPAFAYAYLAPTWKNRIWKMLLAGLLSCPLRMLDVEPSWELMGLSFILFPVGALPFIGLWLLAMRLADPARKRPKESER